MILKRNGGSSQDKLYDLLGKTKGLKTNIIKSIKLFNKVKLRDNVCKKKLSLEWSTKQYLKSTLKYIYI